jgi:xanthine dehydrogenase YagS FAD-binding subunit
MQLFEYLRPKDMDGAIQLGAQARTAQQGAEVRYVAGGTTVLDLMTLDVEQPRQLVDINHIGLDKIETAPNEALLIGAMVRNSDLAHHPQVKQRYSVLSEAVLSGASGQLRNMATTGGNLLQRTRCAYFRDPAMACNKRMPGSGCSAIDGENRTMAVLGTSEYCIATHPSDMAVALVALDAQVHIRGTRGERVVPIQDFHLLPGDTPHVETVMQPGDLITSVILPPSRPRARSGYLKLRDRASYEFALASAAVVAELDGDRFVHVRVGLGGVGTKPWRSFPAERTLQGRIYSESLIREAAQAAMAEARPQSQNRFKVDLVQLCIAQMLRTVAGKAHA